MKKLLIIITFVVFGTGFVPQQQKVDEIIYAFGKKIFEDIQNNKTDDIINMINAKLKDEQKETIALSLMNTMDKINYMGGLSDARLINVLQKELPSGSQVLYLPFFKSNKIKTIKVGAINNPDNKWTIEGPIKFVSEAKDNELTAGYKLYMSKCFACHGRYGEGSIGPNLTDDYWKFVRTENDIFNVIKEGKAGTMMIAYNKYLSDDEIRQIVKFINLMQGQKLKKGKAPEGEKINFKRTIY